MTTDSGTAALRVAILGAGITGLSAAYYLQKSARAQGREVRITLVDRAARLGGKIITDHLDDFIVEGGPDSFVTDKPWCLELCHELGLAGQLVPSNQLERKVYVLRKGRLVEFPTGFRLTIPTEIAPFLFTTLISPLGKLRMALDYFIPPRKEEGDETLAQFIRRRLGNEALDRFAGPLMAGIFVSDPERLSMMGTFPRFLEMERKHGSLIRAARRAKKQPHPPRQGPAPAGGAMFNALKPGMNALVDELGRRFEGEVRLGAQATVVRAAEPGFEVGFADGPPLAVDQVLVTTPAPVSADLLEELHPKLSSRLRQIRYVSTATVSCAYLFSDLPASRPLDGFGVLIPPSEGRRIIACTWASTKFKHRAPPGHVLLRAFVGGYRDEDVAKLPDDELIALVRAEFESLMGLSAEPLFTRIYRWIDGNPQYDVGHLDRVDVMEAMAAECPGLHLAGSAFRGIGMPDCIHSAQQAVAKILPAQPHRG